MKSCKIRFFIGRRGLFAMRCAVFHHEDSRHHHELPGLCTTKTVVIATKTVIAMMKTVVMPAKRQISFEIFRPAPTFVYYRRFSESLAFSQCQDFCSPTTKKLCFSISRRPRFTGCSLIVSRKGETSNTNGSEFYSK